MRSMSPDIEMSTLTHRRRFGLWPAKLRRSGCQCASAGAAVSLGVSASRRRFGSGGSIQSKSMNTMRAVTLHPFLSHLARYCSHAVPYRARYSRACASGSGGAARCRAPKGRQFCCSLPNLASTAASDSRPSFRGSMSARTRAPYPGADVEPATCPPPLSDLPDVGGDP